MKLTTKRKFIIGALLVAVVIIGAGITWASSGNSGQIMKETMQAPAKRLPAFADYNGKYISFTHLGSYSEHQIEAKDLDLEVAMLTASTTYDKRLAVAVSRLNGGTLSSNSAYSFRSSQAGTYTSHQVSTPGGTASVWVKNDNLEQTAFIQRNDTVATLAFTTAGNADDLNPEVAAVLASFRWK